MLFFSACFFLVCELVFTSIHVFSSLTRGAYTGMNRVFFRREEDNHIFKEKILTYFLSVLMKVMERFANSGERRNRSTLWYS